MTPEERTELLKNCLVARVQKDKDWASHIELAVQLEVMSVLVNWIDAAVTEHIGPKEFLNYLKKLQELVKNEKIEDIQE